MGTKLRNFSYNTLVKAIAFLVAVISFGLAFSYMGCMIESTKGANELFSMDYLSTPVAEMEVQETYISIERLFALRNEDYIVNELGINDYGKQIEYELTKLETAKNYLSTVEGVYYYVSDGENTFTNCDMTKAAEFKRFNLYNIRDRHSYESTISFYAERYIQSESYTKVFIALEDNAQEKADDMYTQLYTLVSLKNEQYISDKALKERDEQIQSNLRELAQHQKYLNSLEGIYYYATDGDSVLTNCNQTTANEFKNHKNYNIIDGYVTEFKIGKNANASMSLSSNRKVFIAYDDDFVANRQVEFDKTKVVLQQEATKIIMLSVLSILMLVYLIFVCGRSTTNITMLTIDRLWTELTLGALIIVAGSFIVCAIDVLEGSSSTIFTEFLPVVIVISAIVCAVCLMFLLSLVRHLKNKTLVKHSLIFIVCHKVFGVLKNVFKTIFNITPLNIKIIGGILLAELVTVILSVMVVATDGDAIVWFFILIIAATAGIIYTILKFVIKPYDDEVKTRLALSLNREMKAERLKTELITNVSHDLKTPLTAIINYSDLLLKQEEENEYAKVIYDKSQKLKTLTEDLFEVSKAQSGNIATTLEQLNVSELINQTLAEFDDYTVDFKQNIQNVSILADGKLMSRVIENLIGNMIKYSLPNTRAYIDSFEKDCKTYITFKNIANYEMGFDSSEMTERFSRGDTSRTTDGNGLGLAIAQSYTEASGGRLTIDTDGDLFKVTLVF